MPEFVLGFKVLADQLGRDVVGEPLEDEHPWPDGTAAVQTTSKGLMWYSRAANKAAFIPFELRQ
jgi:hypothetical protein